VPRQRSVAPHDAAAIVRYDEDDAPHGVVKRLPARE
jgi:hypothetical protein